MLEISKIFHIPENLRTSPDDKMRAFAYWTTLSECEALNYWKRKRASWSFMNPDVLSDCETAQAIM